MYGNTRTDVLPWGAILMHLSEPAIDRFIPNQNRTNPPRICISRPMTQVYFPPPLNFSESRRIRVLSRSRACRARAYAREFASVDFLQPLENSRAAREFSGNLPENSFTGSGQYWNSGIGTVLEFPMISNRTLRVISSRGVSSAD